MREHVVHFPGDPAALAQCGRLGLGVPADLQLHEQGLSAISLAHDLPALDGSLGEERYRKTGE